MPGTGGVPGRSCPRAELPVCAARDLSIKHYATSERFMNQARNRVREKRPPDTSPEEQTAPRGLSRVPLFWSSSDRLRQVITERGEDHSVQPVRFKAQRTGPGVARHIGVLRPPLEAAFGPVVQAVPEAGSAFDHHARIGRAAGEASGQESAVVD